MANPTAQVPARTMPYGADDKFYLPYPTGQSDTFYPGEMIGMDPSTGYGAHFDDTKALQFWGLFAEPQRQISTDLPSPILLMCKRPRLFTMPLSTGTVNRAYLLGAPVYAKTSGTVTLDPTGLTYANIVGSAVDIDAATPETLTGAKSLWIAPPILPRTSGNFGVLVGPDTAKSWGVEALNRTIECTITTARTYTLPPIAETVPGDWIAFNTLASTTNVLTIKGNASENINGANTKALAGASYSVAKVVSDGTRWLLMASI